MAPKRKDATQPTTTPSSTPPSSNSASLKPSSAASSASKTSSPLKPSNAKSPKSGGGLTFGHSSNTPYTAPSSSTTSSNTAATTTTSTTTSSSSAGAPTVTSKKGSSSSAAALQNDASHIVQGVWERYVRETPQRVKLLDTFMAFLVALGGIQFLYAVVGGNYPFNAFLSGFSATVGQFVLTASLRIQTNAANAKEFPEGFSDERAFADFVGGSLLLHFFCVNFIN